MFSGDTTLVTSTLSENTAAGGPGGRGGFGPGGVGGLGAGGGLDVLSGKAQLSKSTVSGNHASGALGGTGECAGCLGDLFAGGNGGAAQEAGLFIAAGALGLRQTTVSANSATGGMGGRRTTNFTGGNGTSTGAGGGSSLGAGIFVGNGDISLANSTFFANQARGGAAARVFCAPTCSKSGKGGDAAGGGLYLSAGSISLTGDSIASNQALTGVETVNPGSSLGAGIANAGATSFLTNTTLIGNNTQDSGRANNGNNMSGPVTSSYSLFGQTAGAAITDDGGNLLDVAPVLDPGGLKFNGGPTQNDALESGSPAIDVVPVAHCTDLALPPNPLIIDQRGFPRPDIGDSNCDIGAYEVEDTSFLPFSHFGGGLKIDPDAGVFYLSGGFKLGSGGTIDPTTQPVAFRVGDYAIRLPVSSFVQHSTGYVYQKRINGIFLCVFIKFTDVPGTYQLLANRFGGTLNSTTGPVPVTLTIGDNSGTTQMSAKYY